MARVETVKCDQCGAIKGEGNHWLELDVAAMEISCSIDPTKHWHAPAAGFERHDLCGQDCFHKHLDALLFTKPKPTD